LDIVLELPLTIVEATLGTTVGVPTLAGKAEVTVPPGTSSGQRLRLRGQGIKSEKGTGDLFVVARIVVPKELSDEDREALRLIGDRLPSPRSGRLWE
jgi:DnaJ-class molecular chaperone